MWKGFNDLHGLDLGDYVAELASAEHSTSLHVQIMAAQSTLAAFGGYARPTKDESSVLLDQPDYSWLRPVVEMLPASRGGDLSGIVLDLRKLRFRHLAMSSQWEHLVYGYDLLVMFPRFTPANLYH